MTYRKVTYRKARRKLGSRNQRRMGTKTRVIPGRGDKQPPKYTTRRAAKGKESNASKVRKLVAASASHFVGDAMQVGYWGGTHGATSKPALSPPQPTTKRV